MLRQQRELTESTGKKEFRRGEKESDIIGWNDEHTHTHTHTKRQGGEWQPKYSEKRNSACVNAKSLQDGNTTEGWAHEY